MKYLFLIFLFSCTKIHEVYRTTDVENSMSIYQKPNIILILVDDFGYELPGYTGGTSWPTPNIDALAARSVRFSDCNVMPLCSPTRIELITGQYNFRNYTDWALLDMNDVCIAERLKAVGYATCAAGKWQMNNGDAGLKAAGFDNYMIWNPFKDGFRGNKYKDPSPYENGAFLPDSITLGKYGEDFYRQYVFDFIDSNKNNPFYIYWAPNLTHSPMQPTPDDPEFATWTSGELNNDPIWFANDVKYLDKEIGMLVHKLDSMQLTNTLVLFVGDNGTEHQITSIWRDDTIAGGKSHTFLYGTHVPLLAWWPGVTTPHDDSSLIDASDFFPTITWAAKADSSSPDGTSFLPRIRGLPGHPREWMYFWYKYNLSVPLEVWARDRTWSKYDSTGDHNGAFYNYKTQPLEKRPITIWTPLRTRRANYLQSIIDSLKN